MPDWRQRILEQFTPEVSRITVATDPDGLLTEERLYAAITSLGFSVLPFEDPIEFRYRYESEFRDRWDEGAESELVVVDGRDQLQVLAARGLEGLGRVIGVRRVHRGVIPFRTQASGAASSNVMARPSRRTPRSRNSAATS